MTDKLTARTFSPSLWLFALLLPACAAGGTSAASPHGGRHPGVGPGFGAIQGVVRDVGTGQPISFVTVYAHSPSLEDERSATTGGDGEYRLDELAPGNYRVTARYSDFIARYDDVTVRAGKETTVDIRILASGSTEGTDSAASTTGPTAVDQGDAAPPHGRTGNIEGTVIDGVSGAALPGAVVTATAPHMRDARFAMADDHGGFRLLGLRPDTYTLSVYYHLIDRGNIEVRKANIVLRGGDTITVDLRLDAKPYD